MRRALDLIAGGDPPGAELSALRTQYPGWIDAVLEDERADRPAAVAALRERMGLDPDPWTEMIERAIALYRSAGDPAERVRIAAGLLAGDGEGLSALTIALCHHPEGGPLLAAVHAVAPTAEQRRMLSGYLVRRRRGSPGLDDPGFHLNRDSPAFHRGFLDGDELAMVFREYPGRYSVFAMQLGEGVTEVVIRPVPREDLLAEVLRTERPGMRRALSLDDCRALLASAIAAQGPRAASEGWRALGHLVEERLFPCPDEAPGFVIGEADARLFLDRFARILVEGDKGLLSEIVFPGSAAEILLDLVGPRGLTAPLGVEAGVSRLEVVFETTRSYDATAILVGRSPSDEPLTCTRFRLCAARGMWWLHEIEVLGLRDDRLLRSIWEVMGGPRHLPLQLFDELSEAEQELVVGLIDDGYRLDEVAAVLHLGRSVGLEGAPGDVAAACHLSWARLCGEPVFTAHIIERYGAEAEAVSLLMEALPDPPEPLQFATT